VRFFFLTAGFGLIASFAGKFLADAYLQERVAIIGSFAGLQYSRNPGIAFGLKLPSGFQEIFIIAALIFVCFLAFKSAKTRISRIAYGLIVGGALGNVLDRLLDGYVTDFFQVGTFPIFNVADSCITVGVAFLLAESLTLVRRTTRS
jgi:signal peptidase II